MEITKPVRPTRQTQGENQAFRKLRISVIVFVALAGQMKNVALMPPITRNGTTISGISGLELERFACFSSIFIPLS